MKVILYFQKVRNELIFIVVVSQHITHVLGRTCALFDMLVKIPVKLSSTIITAKPDIIVASGVFAPHELLTAEREKEPVVV